MRIKFYYKKDCVHCNRARNWLLLNNYKSYVDEFEAESNGYAPYFYLYDMTNSINMTIGDFDDLIQWKHSGKLASYTKFQASFIFKIDLDNFNITNTIFIEKMLKIKNISYDKIFRAGVIIDPLTFKLQMSHCIMFDTVEDKALFENEWNTHDIISFIEKYVKSQQHFDLFLEYLENNNYNWPDEWSDSDLVYFKIVCSGEE